MMRRVTLRVASFRCALVVVVFFALLGGLFGCAGSRVPVDEMEKDIRWLTVSLQHKGVLVRERGSAFVELPSVSDARLIIDSKEVLDAFEFESADQARDQAFRLAGMYPRNDVYRVERLVVVRFTTRDTGLSGTLLEILGTPV